MVKNTLLFVQSSIMSLSNYSFRTVFVGSFACTYISLAIYLILLERSGWSWLEDSHCCWGLSVRLPDCRKNCIFFSFIFVCRQAFSWWFIILAVSTFNLICIWWLHLYSKKTCFSLTFQCFLNMVVRAYGTNKITFIQIVVHLAFCGRKFLASFWNFS